MQLHGDVDQAFVQYLYWSSVFGVWGLLPSLVSFTKGITASKWPCNSVGTTLHSWRHQKGPRLSVLAFCKMPLSTSTPPSLRTMFSHWWLTGNCSVMAVGVAGLQVDRAEGSKDRLFSRMVTTCGTNASIEPVIATRFHACIAS